MIKNETKIIALTSNTPLEVIANKIGLSARTYNALMRTGVDKLDKLLKVLDLNFISNISNIGIKSEEELKEKINKLNIDENILNDAINKLEVTPIKTNNSYTSFIFKKKHITQNTPIDYIGISNNAINFFKRKKNINVIKDITKYTIKELKSEFNKMNSLNELNYLKEIIIAINEASLFFKDQINLNNINHEEIWKRIINVLNDIDALKEDISKKEILLDIYQKLIKEKKELIKKENELDNSLNFNYHKLTKKK